MAAVNSASGPISVGGTAIFTAQSTGQTPSEAAVPLSSNGASTLYVPLCTVRCHERVAFDRFLSLAKAYYEQQRAKGKPRNTALKGAGVQVDSDSLSLLEGPQALQRRNLPASSRPSSTAPAVARLSASWNTKWYIFGHRRLRAYGDQPA
jgi:hypothetical protein